MVYLRRYEMGMQDDNCCLISYQNPTLLCSTHQSHADYHSAIKASCHCHVAFHFTLQLCSDTFDTYTCIFGLQFYTLMIMRVFSLFLLDAHHWYPNYHLRSIPAVAPSEYCEDKDGSLRPTADPGF